MLHQRPQLIRRATRRTAGRHRRFGCCRDRETDDQGDDGEVSHHLRSPRRVHLRKFARRSLWD